MAKAEDIREHMEVLGSDGEHVGTVDHMEGPDTIKLTRSDPKAGGQHHYISLDWVGHVDRQVHLNKTCEEAMRQWRAA